MIYTGANGMFSHFFIIFYSQIKSSIRSGITCHILTPIIILNISCSSSSSLNIKLYRVSMFRVCHAVGHSYFVNCVVLMTMMMMRRTRKTIEEPHPNEASFFSTFRFVLCALNEHTNVAIIIIIIIITATNHRR